MECLHPHCPMPTRAITSWKDTVEKLDNRSDFTLRRQDKEPLLTWLNGIDGLGKAHIVDPYTGNKALFERLLACCPCLYTQINIKVTADATVHLCETTLQQKITGNNVEQAFLIQHTAQPGFTYPPIDRPEHPGHIAEAFCREILINAKITSIGSGTWHIPGFIDFNSGTFTTLAAFGDFLIPAAPSNIIISCKMEAARERLLNSGVRGDTVGFGFFKDASEFHTKERMNLLQRFGFTAIYMPQDTLNEIERRLSLFQKSAVAVVGLSAKNATERVDRRFY